MSAKPKAHVAQYKKDAVKKISKLMQEYPIIAVANLHDLPANALQRLRGLLRGKVEIVMTRANLFKLALNDAKSKVSGIEKLESFLGGMPALIFTKENPFSLYRTVKKNKSPAAAKPGQLAPNDITIPAGPTPFAPGPVISELSQLGLKAGVESGKIAIKESKVVVHEGQPISAPLAGMLTRLGIQPMEVGLNLVAVFEKGIIYDKKVLDVDEKQFMDQISRAATYARNLSVEVAFPTKQTIELLLQKAFRSAKGLAVSQGILAKGVVEEVLAKAFRAGAALKELIR